MLIWVLLRTGELLVWKNVTATNVSFTSSPTFTATITDSLGQHDLFHLTTADGVAGYGRDVLPSKQSQLALLGA